MCIKRFIHNFMRTKCSYVQSLRASLSLKIKNLNNKIAEEEIKNSNLTFKFENLEKAFAKQSEEIKNAPELKTKTVTDLAKIIHDLELSIKHYPDTEKECFLNSKESLILIHKNFLKFLEQRNIEQIDCLGDIFDSELHNCIKIVQIPEKAHDEIVEVYQKGYKQDGKIIIHAIVVVNNLK